MQLILRQVVLLGTAMLVGSDSIAATLIVPGDANIYGAGHAIPPAPAGGGAGILPPLFVLPSGPGRLLQFSGVSGTVSNIDGSQLNPPDGSVWPAALTSFGGISGFQAPTTVALVGVFLGSDEPTDPAPLTIDFNLIGLSFTELSPAVGQIFFIGDGLTGSGLGLAQTFHVPDDATRLFLGIPDGWIAAGPPGYYGDNAGSFTASFTVVPEPASVALVSLGVLFLLLVRRRANHRIT